jgi:hypothetical protein
MFNIMFTFEVYWARQTNKAIFFSWFLETIKKVSNVFPSIKAVSLDAKKRELLMMCRLYLILVIYYVREILLCILLLCKGACHFFELFLALLQ